MKNITLGINRIISPDLTLNAFFKLCQSLEIEYVELRNDIRNGQIFDGHDPSALKQMSQDHGITIFAINAFQQFNKPGRLDEKVFELRELLNQAKAFDCRALVMCPVNDPADGRTDEQASADTITALKTYAPYFEESGITGLVEPLGFSICSLRTKQKAIEAIRNSGTVGLFKLVHDTFHHFLSGEENFYPDETGLVHISGVEETIAKEEINDNHRVLVGSNDRMFNIRQIQELVEGGFEGVFSYEPFGPQIQRLPVDRLKEELEKSMRIIKGL